MNIAIFVNRFPVLSQTFVINQIVDLLQDHSVEVICLKRNNENISHNIVNQYNLLEKVRFLGIPNNITLLYKLKFVFKSIVYAFSSITKFKKLVSVLFNKQLDNDQKQTLINMCTNSKQKLNYDHVIVHFGHWGYFVCLMRELGIFDGKISVIFHGYEISRYEMLDENKQAYNELFKMADRLLPISDHWREKLISLGCDNNKIEVRRMGVNVSDFSLRDVNRPFSNPTKLLQVGRLTEKKAILDSIQAVIEARKNVNLEFTIIGDGELFEAAKDLISQHNASDYIRLLGSRTSDDVLQQLYNTDIFLLPSVTAKNGDKEGIPVALMEAMATGAIVISTYHSGIPELVENEVSGFLIKERDINALSNMIIKVAQLNIDKLTEIRNNACDKINNEYNNSILTKELV